MVNFPSRPSRTRSMSELQCHIFQPPPMLYTSCNCMIPAEGYRSYQQPYQHSATSQYLPNLQHGFNQLSPPAPVYTRNIRRTPLLSRTPEPGQGLAGRPCGPKTWNRQHSTLAGCPPATCNNDEWALGDADADAAMTGGRKSTSVPDLILWTICKSTQFICTVISTLILANAGRI